MNVSKKNLYLPVLFALSLINLSVQAAPAYVDTKIEELSNKVNTAQYATPAEQNKFAADLVNVFNKRDPGNEQAVSDLVIKAQNSPLLTPAQKEYVATKMLPALPTPTLEQAQQAQGYTQTEQAQGYKQAPIEQAQPAQGSEQVQQAQGYTQAPQGYTQAPKKASRSMPAPSRQARPAPQATQQRGGAKGQRRTSTTRQTRMPATR